MFEIFILKHFRTSFWVHWHFGKTGVVKQNPTGCFGKPKNWEGELMDTEQSPQEASDGSSLPL